MFTRRKGKDRLHDRGIGRSSRETGTRGAPGGQTKVRLTELIFVVGGVCSELVISVDGTGSHIHAQDEHAVEINEPSVVHEVADERLGVDVAVIRDGKGLPKISRITGPGDRCAKDGP